jgi:hypothetical protein
MENATKTDGKIRYKKIGGGSLRMHRKIIKPGEIFMAYPADIKEGWKNVVVPLDTVPVSEAKKEVVNPKVTAYKLQPRGKSKLWFDVVGPNGKILNDKALKKVTANQLINDLSK